jgi:transposase-like protein
MRESEEDWLCLGRGLTSRGLAEPMMVVCDGAPGLNNAIEQLWPDADRQRCTVQRLRNLVAKLPDDHHELVRSRYWAALEEATDQEDAERRLRGLVGWLSDQGFASAAALPRR